MNEMLDLIKQRRSIRKFEQKEISQEVLNTIFESVQWSQSWANTQCWELMVIKNTEIRERLKSLISPKNPATNAITNSTILLGLVAKLKISGYYKDIPVTKLNDWFMFDIGIAAQNICMTAHSMGLGSVIVGAFDHEKAKEVLSIPDHYELVVLIPIGYPAKISSPPARKNLKDFIHYDKFFNYSDES